MSGEQTKWVDSRRWRRDGPTATAAASRAPSTSSASAGRCSWCASCCSGRSASPTCAPACRASAPTCSPSACASSSRPGSCAAASSRRPPGSRVYELTERGLALEPVMLELGRWGSQAPFPEGEAAFGADSFVIALRTLFDPAAAAGLDVTVRAAAGRGRLPRARGRRAVRGRPRGSRARPTRSSRRVPARSRRCSGTTARSPRRCAPATSRSRAARRGQALPRRLPAHAA